MRRRDNASDLIKTTSGGLATVKYCPFCAKTEEGISRFVFRKGCGGGRGAGLGWGGAVTSKLSAHIRAEHPDKVKLYEKSPA